MGITWKAKLELKKIVQLWGKSFNFVYKFVL